MATKLAFQCDELELEEWERVSARAQYLAYGSSDAADLIKRLLQYGYKVDGYVEAALTCPLEDYYRVKEVYDELPDPPRPTRRKR